MLRRSRSSARAGCWAQAALTAKGRARSSELLEVMHRVSIKEDS